MTALILRVRLLEIIANKMIDVPDSTTGRLVTDVSVTPQAMEAITVLGHKVG